jgi:hypothetical protein
MPGLSLLLVPSISHDKPKPMIRVVVFYCPHFFNTLGKGEIFAYRLRCVHRGMSTFHPRFLRRVMCGHLLLLAGRLYGINVCHSPFNALCWHSHLLFKVSRIDSFI